MNTLILTKNIEKKTVSGKYFNNRYEAIAWWKNLPNSGDYEIIYLKERGPSGHRYDLLFAEYDEETDNLHYRYVICFSKKEAVHLKNIIKRIGEHHIINIRKLY